MTALPSSPENPPAQRDAGEVIVVCPDGPLLVRGDFDIISTTGESLPRQRRTVALCRCGGSAIKPYCDGTHKMNGFRTEIGTPKTQASSTETSEPTGSGPGEPDTGKPETGKPETRR